MRYLWRRGDKGALVFKAKNKNKKAKIQMLEVNFQVLTHLCHLIFLFLVFLLIGKFRRIIRDYKDYMAPEYIYFHLIAIMVLS